MRGPMKSVQRTSQDLAIPLSSVCGILRKRLKLRLLQALKPIYCRLHVNFANELFELLFHLVYHL